MIRDDCRAQARAKCIEVQAKAIYKRHFPAAPVDEHFSWYYSFKDNPQSSVRYSNVAIAILDAAAAFDALHGIATVNPIEATEEMEIVGDAEALKPGATAESVWRAMCANGDLTNGPEKKP